MGSRVSHSANVSSQTSMGMAQYAVFRSPTNFAEPEKFIPERWFGDDLRFANDKREALQPFSFGPRNCIGRKYVSLPSSLLSRWPNSGANFNSLGWKNADAG